MPLAKKYQTKKTTQKAWLDRNTADQATKVFLPDLLPQVRAIAWRGATDTEIAETFGISPVLIEKWKLTYPSFREAIEQGRTHADAQIVESMYKECIGYEYEEDALTRTGSIKRLKKRARPNGDLIKFWLTNRQKDYWSARQSIDGGSSNTRGGGVLPVKTETRADIISNILSLVKPKEDG